MIKILSYVDIAFFYRKANILRRWREQRPMSRLQISLIQMKTWTASRGLWAVAISKSLLCLNAGFSWLFIIWTHSRSRSFCRLTTCTVTCWTLLSGFTGLVFCSVAWSLLMRTDADWTCWLTADARVRRKHKHKFETDSNSGHTVDRSYTAYKQYTVVMPWCVNDCITAESSAAVSWRYHAQEKLLTRFEETAQSEQYGHSNADIEGFICSKLKIFNECTSRLNMPWRCARKVCSVLQKYKWNKIVMTICVIILALPDRTQAYIRVQSFWNRTNNNSCSRGDELHSQFFAFRKIWNRPKYHFFSYQSTSTLCKWSLEASPLSCTWSDHICLTIVAINISVSFFNACYVWFGPVFFCIYEECKPLINLSGSP